jgi:hypothetical protein
LSALGPYFYIILSIPFSFASLAAFFAAIIAAVGELSILSAPESYAGKPFPLVMSRISAFMMMMTASGLLRRF